MGALLVLLVIGGVSLLVVRVGGTALMMTGMSWDAATFQAYSAFFGVGFTTKEAEMVVNHPIRRRIIRDLILVGNVGLTSALATLIVTFVGTTGTKQTLTMIGLIIVVLGGLLLLTKIGFLNRAIDYTIRQALAHAGMVHHALDYDLLLRVQSGYCISEVDVLEGNIAASRRLGESRPADKGIIVLGITHKGGAFTGAPGPNQSVVVGDVLTVYGMESDVRKFVEAEARPKRDERESRTD